jgi:hypothetical protein
VQRVDDAHSSRVGDRIIVEAMELHVSADRLLANLPRADGRSRSRILRAYRPTDRRSARERQIDLIRGGRALDTLKTPLVGRARS